MRLKAKAIQASLKGKELKMTKMKRVIRNQCCSASDQMSRKKVLNTYKQLFN